MCTFPSTAADSVDPARHFIRRLALACAAPAPSLRLMVPPRVQSRHASQPTPRAALRPATTPSASITDLCARFAKLRLQRTQVLQVGPRVNVHFNGHLSFLPLLRAAARQVPQLPPLQQQPQAAASLRAPQPASQALVGSLRPSDPSSSPTASRSAQGGRSASGGGKGGVKRPM